jgi:hypothetical protein
MGTADLFAATGRVQQMAGGVSVDARLAGDIRAHRVSSSKPIAKQNPMKSKVSGNHDVDIPSANSAIARSPSTAHSVVNLIQKLPDGYRRQKYEICMTNIKRIDVSAASVPRPDQTVTRRRHTATIFLTGAAGRTNHETPAPDDLPKNMHPHSMRTSVLGSADRSKTSRCHNAGVGPFEVIAAVNQSK